jgi:hypothetical protein
MFFPPTFASVLSLSGGSPVPPGPNLGYNKFFDVDDRYDDGWSSFSSNGNITATGGEWAVTGTTTGNKYQTLTRSGGAITKIRTKVKFTYSYTGAPRQCTARIVLSDRAGTFATGAIVLAEALSNGNVMITFSSNDASYLQQELSLTEWFWIQIESTGGGVVKLSVLNDSLVQVGSLSASLIGSVEGVYAQIQEYQISSNANITHCEQLSYDRT